MTAFSKKGSSQKNIKKRTVVVYAKKTAYYITKSGFVAKNFNEVGRPYLMAQSVANLSKYEPKKTSIELRFVFGYSWITSFC